ncbi:MAG: hypothetical protein LH610_09465 [Sphingomonas bacterium]|nr:hypothetical protein [Sphingomonas bacterium]
MVSLPSEIRALVTDDLGNPSPTYAGSLQLSDRSVFEEVESRNLFVCFRAAHQTYADHVQTVPNAALYSELRDELIHLGWDVCVGDGWVSASLEGYFPMDAINGKMEADEALLNRWGLFASLEDALECCTQNNEQTSDYPWYPVAIAVDESSYRRLATLTRS